VLRGYYAGAHEYLTKPLDQAELLRKIAKLIGT
jgi:DNA-binding response OmpR family regulator